ncbi:MAG: hypothetical protein A2901_02665 [Elusimicrobia bacterium RIFCSPLOWO2_01_FULL_54_10]|nr:MAG: hypothetical protein A2901_02665 [Elusimicrobia bacterium RIFCSPLOWO2_01_FULL_54_10]
MNYLILNCGSSTLKYKILSMPHETALAQGVHEGTVSTNEELCGIIRGACKDIPIHKICHRVVHGGEKYRAAVRVTDEVIKDIQDLSDLAPLHNPANLAGIRAAMEVFPNIPNDAVFDTSFHQTLPPKAYLYGLPYELYEKFKIRKYGFHGISHKYVSRKAMEILKESIKDFKILSCHLGSGASICAIERGKSIEISMGFTPLDGLMMGTRAGSFDPEIVIYLQKKGYSLDEIQDMMLRRGGLKGISQSSNDVRELREDELQGNPKSELAFEMFVYRVQRFIGSYAAALGGVDLVIFTGGIGENAHYLRKRICDKHAYMGLKLDARKNRANEAIISAADSEVLVMAIPTNEELQIARECHALERALEPVK